MSTPQTLVGLPAEAAPSPVLDSLAHIDRLVEYVEQLAEQLASHLPGSRTRRGFRDGRWVVGLFRGGGMQARSAYTRVDVEIRLHDHGQRLELTTRKTVRDQDLLRGHFEGALDAAGWRSAQVFLEREFLDFAESWFLSG